MGGASSSGRSGLEVIAEFLRHSPFVVRLGIVADQLAYDEVRLRLPWDPANTTVGDKVDGGAIATLAGQAVMAADWCGADAPPVGRALRRGRSLLARADVKSPDTPGIWALLCLLGGVR